MLAWGVNGLQLSSMVNYKAKHSRGGFKNILLSSLGPEDFYFRIAALLDRDPYFMRGYLELLWIAEKKGDRIMYKGILEHCLRYIVKIYLSPRLQSELSEVWALSDKIALKEVLLLVNKEVGWHSFLQKISILLQMVSIDKVIEIKTLTTPKEERHLRLIKEINVQGLKKELKGVAEYWWDMNTDRSDSIDYHKYTRSILLRERKGKSVLYEPINTVHESLETPFTSMFPKIYETILSLAEELNIGLGRVAIVRLDAYSQVYRHYDSEEFLKNRERYHLVVECGKKNLLESGSNSFFVKEGQLWFFDNKVMHRAHNLSGQSRVHVIFDGYPLGNVLQKTSN